MTEAYVYLFLGCTGSGRRQVLYDLVSDVVSAEEPFVVLRSSSETPNDWDRKLADSDHVSIQEYSGGVGGIAPDALMAQHTHVILAPGNANPVDQVEALKFLLEASGLPLGRILTITHCGLLEEHDALRSWYDACIHFSDVCLINRGETTSNQYVQDFIDRYHARHFPCLFEVTKKGRVKNPGLIWEPQARRISLYFEPEEDMWLDEEDDDPVSDQDLYLERLASGARKKWLPDVQKVLQSEA